MRYHCEKRISKTFAAIIVSVILFVLCFGSVEKKLHSSVNSLCTYYCNQSASLTVNQCVSKVLEKNKISYSQLSDIIYDKEGKISSIQTNTAVINQIQSEITQMVLSEFDKKNYKNIEVPIGTISGFYLLNGRGPEVKIRLIPAGDIKTEIRSELEGAGINQSCHRIVIDITCDMSAIFPGGEKKSTIKISCILAETVIVGDVPEGIISTLD